MSALNDAPTLQALRPLRYGAVDDYPVAMAWAPDGATLAVADAGGAVTTFGRDGERQDVFTAHEAGALDLSWSHDGQSLVTSGQDGCARVWDAAGHCLATLPGNSQWLEHVACAPGKDVIAVADGRQLRFWRTDGTPLMACEPEAYTLLALGWLPEGRVITGAYGGASVWHPDHVCAVKRYPWQGALLTVAPSPDGTRLAAGLQEAGVQYWDLESEDALYMRGYATKVRALGWDPTSRYLATGGGASMVIWDCGGEGPAGTEPVVLDLHVKPITALAFAPKGRALASGSRDGSGVIVDPTAETAAASLVRDEPVTGLAWDPRGERLAFAFADGRVAICPGSPSA